jgi:hypothetical protein
MLLQLKRESGGECALCKKMNSENKKSLNAVLQSLNVHILSLNAIYSAVVSGIKPLLVAPAATGA